MSNDSAWRKKNSGEPGNGGEFGARARSEAETHLTGANPVVDLTFPQPQANDLDKVISVIDAVAAGANTGDAVGEALAIADREGAYYADAAGYLGLVQTVAGPGPKTYELTPAGEELLGASAADRVSIISERAQAVPGLQLLDEFGEEGVREFIDAQGFAESTAGRRTSTMVSWSRALTNPDDLSRVVGSTVTEVQGRSAAAVHAAEVRAARESELRALAPKPAETCTGCWMEISVSGACGC